MEPLREAVLGYRKEQLRAQQEVGRSQWAGLEKRSNQASGEDDTHGSTFC